MANVKVFWRTDGQKDGRTDRQKDRVITIGHPPSGGALKNKYQISDRPRRELRSILHHASDWRKFRGQELL